MKMKKLTFRRLISILLLAAGAVSLLFGIRSFGGSGIGKPYDARQGVVVVQALVTDGQNIVSGQGTGWAIGTPGQQVEYIVTNGHVVEAAYALPQQSSAYTGEVQVIFSQAENDYVTAEVVYYSAPEEKDLAILKLPAPTDKRAPLSIRPSDDVEIGENAWALGYPGITSQNQQYSTYDPEDATLTQGVISKRNRPNGVEYEAFQIDTYINHGNSGGPLLDEKGNVIGITTSGISYDGVSMEGVNYAIIADELTRILDSEGISYTTADTGSFRIGFVLLPLGILLLAGGAIFLLRGLHGGRTADASDAAGWKAGNAFAAMGKRAGGDSAAEGKRAGGAVGAEAGNSGQASSGRAVLRGVAGKYAGQSFVIPKEGIVIGRDAASCNIIFDAATPGISRRHCRIVCSPAESCFWLTDLGSSYGTFAGGRKLAANTPEKLASGDVFSLCDSANCFSVSLE